MVPPISAAYVTFGLGLHTTVTVTVAVKSN